MNNIQTVLMIDDNQADHIIANEAISSYDPNIVLLSAYDGAEGLALLERGMEKPDLILLDINMPGMDGHEFLKEYSKRDDTSTVIIMLTTSDQTSDKEKCLAYDFVYEYVIKPIELAKFRALVERAEYKSS